MMLAAIDGTVGPMGAGGYIENPGVGGGGFGSAFYSPGANPVRPAPAPAAPPISTPPSNPGPSIFWEPPPVAPVAGPPASPVTTSPTTTSPSSTPGPAQTDPWGGVVGALSNFWNMMPSAPPAPPAPVSAPPASSAATDTALNNLLSLASAQFAAAGSGGGGGAPASPGMIDPSLLAGGSTAPVDATSAGTTPAPSASTGPNKLAIVVIVLAVGGLAFYLYKRHKARAAA